MSDKGKKRYYVRSGRRIYPNLTIGTIVHNIRIGKLLPEHEISTGETDTWTQLGSVPELKKYFDELDKAVEATDIQSAVTPHVKTQLYEVDTEEGLQMLTRGQVITKINKHEIDEVDRIRPKGSAVWSMVGDMTSFSRHFDNRRVEMKKRGGAFKDYGLPFYIDLMTFFKFFADTKFLFNLAGIGIFLLIPKIITIPIVSGPISIITNFYIYAYYFRIISYTANGHKKFPEYPDFGDLGTELVKPSVQFFLTQFFAAIPLLVMTYFILFGGEMGFSDYLFTFFPFFFIIIQAPILTVTYGGAIAGVLVLFAMLYVPISLMRQSAYGEFWPTLNIPAVVISVQRALVPYLFLLLYLFIMDVLGFVIILVVVFAVGATAAYAATDMSGVALQFMGATMPVAIEMTMQVVVIVFTFFKMYYIGRYLYQNAERMGWE